MGPVASLPTRGNISLLLHLQEQECHGFILWGCCSNCWRKPATAGKMLFVPSCWGYFSCAVRMVRTCAQQKKFPLTLGLCVCCKSDFICLSLSGCFAAEPVRPIDPAAWISHTTAMTGAYPRYGMSPSMSITTSTSSSLTSSIPDSESKSHCGQRRAGGSCSGPAVPSCAQIRPQSHARWKRQRPHNSWMLSDVCGSIGEHKTFF